MKKLLTLFAVALMCVSAISIDNNQITLGEWYDDEVGLEEFDVHTLDPHPGKVEIYIHTRHSVSHEIAGRYLRIWLHPAENDCHVSRDFGVAGDRDDEYCMIRTARSPAFVVNGDPRYVDGSSGLKIVVAGWNHAGRYSLKALPAWR